MGIRGSLGQSVYQFPLRFVTADRNIPSASLRYSDLRRCVDKQVLLCAILLDVRLGNAAGRRQLHLHRLFFAIHLEMRHLESLRATHVFGAYPLSVDVVVVVVARLQLE